jgi:hypothetical protein
MGDSRSVWVSVFGWQFRRSFSQQAPRRLSFIDFLTGGNSGLSVGLGRAGGFVPAGLFGHFIPSFQPLEIGPRGGFPVLRIGYELIAADKLKPSSFRS